MDFAWIAKDGFVFTVYMTCAFTMRYDAMRCDDANDTMVMNGVIGWPGAVT